MGTGGNPDVETVLAALEAHNGSPFFGRGFIDPVSATTIEGETAFLSALVSRLSSDIYGDEYSGTILGPPGGGRGNDLVQHAIDSAAGGPAGAYAQAYSGDYFNGADWRVVVRDALDATITAQGGGIPADSPRPDSTYVHPLAAIYPSTLTFDPTGIGNRGIWEQIVEVGPVVRGEFIFPLGQSGFIDTDGNPDYHFTSLHKAWAEWRFVPMLHIAEDLATDPDGDVDNDGVVDAFERWYFDSTSPGAKDDFDSDGLSLLGEYLAGLDPTDADTDDSATLDGDEDPDEDGCTNGREAGQDETLGGLRNPIYPYDYYDVYGVGQTLVRDGVIDLPNDILGVIQHFAPQGLPPYDVRFDRGPTIGANHWERDVPDGVIDLPNDILGVIKQFQHNCV